MNKNQNTDTVRGRGRPHKTIILPKTSRFTLTDIAKLNGVVRLTIYNQLNDGTLKIVPTGKTRKTDGPGKPGDVFMRLSAWEKIQTAEKRSEASKKAAQTRKAKLAAAPAVDMFPIPAPEQDPTPEVAAVGSVNPEPAPVAETAPEVVPVA